MSKRRLPDWDTEEMARENLPVFMWGTREYALIIRGIDIGADAILEALTSQEHQDFLATLEGESCMGKWVFIPDE